MDHAARMAAKMAAFYHVSLRELHKAPFILSAGVMGLGTLAVILWVRDGAHRGSIKSTQAA